MDSDMISLPALHDIYKSCYLFNTLRRTNALDSHGEQTDIRGDLDVLFYLSIQGGVYGLKNRI